MLAMGNYLYENKRIARSPMFMIVPPALNTPGKIRKIGASDVCFAREAAIRRFKSRKVGYINS